ncbi:amino acid adenylation domain-containing protein [Nonomuraea turkmeniaca]|uniref:Amino acid adenylation domain-containing protein n=1 Tax=Nonomuraea turkmeniaca TaxID=103838 RepID=A0A5S4FF38_9ACTN|nr:non-ribosomal peptide synthetase [Nonomuraea turkmeniaca]TMR17668.1 amino acid adenylation domain-containing protein [Nonomuraea turkmeniaca]
MSDDTTPPPPGAVNGGAGTIWRWLDKAPDAVAVTGSDGQVTYRELYRRVEDLAAVLRGHGVGPEAPVGLCVERTTGMLVAMLAVWTAGGAYVPLDPAFPAERLRMMRHDAGIGLVLTQAGVDPALLEGVPTVLTLSPGGRPVNGAPRSPAQVPAMSPDVDRLAYLMFTSGSTGRPKGVAVPRRAVANLLEAFADLLPIGPEDRWLAVTTLSFDISVLELLLPLYTGGRVVIAATAEVSDGWALRERAAAEGVTIMQATPAGWRILLESGGIPATIRTRLCGGEALPRDLADALLADGAELWNVYGPTETTVWSTAGRVRPGPEAVDLGSPIGRTSVHLLNENGTPVADGEIGELHIGGAGVARGYHGLPAQTAARFLPDPYADTPGARMYATGDLARITRAGRLEYLGRADQQVKIHGFRIELGEIEAVLRAADEVKDAAVAVRDGHLVAYLVPRAQAVDWAVLRERLRASLPDYMIPVRHTTLTSLPLTPNGKLDRAALPTPSWTRPGTAAFRAPATAVESDLAEIWAGVLGATEPIGADDDFFELGGHSLAATQIIARVQARYGLEVPIITLFEHPTIAGFAARLDDMDDADLSLTDVAALRDQLDGLSAEELQGLFDDLAAGS